VDVAALRPDELTPRRTLPVLAPALLLVALVALLAVLAVHVSRTNARTTDRDAALAAARQEAVNLTTLSYRTPTRDLDRVLAGATGRLHNEFAAETAQLPGVLKAQRSVSTGQLVSSGVVSAAPGTVRVVVAADATVRSATSAATVKHYRMVLTVVRRGGRWLVSDVAFAGVPQ
jgi:Mce-associated membrane protein